MKFSLQILFSFLLVCSAGAQERSNLYSAEIQKFASDPQTDSIHQFIKNKIEAREYYGAVSPTLEIIKRLNETGDLLGANQFRYLLARLYYILGWYPKAISNLEYCHVFFANNRYQQDLVKSCLLMALVQLKAQNSEQSSYFLGLVEAEKATKNNPYFYHKYSIINATLKDSMMDTQAIQVIGESLKYAKASGLPELEALSYQLIGDYYTKRGLAREACFAYNNSLHISDSLRFMADVLNLNQKIFYCLQEQNLHKEANQALLNYIAINDSITKFSLDNEVKRAIDRFENKELREDKIDLAKNQRLLELKSRRSNFTMVSLLFGVGAILIAVFLILLFYQQRLSANEIILRQSEEINFQKIRELENSMALQNMQSMLKGQEVERERIAKDLHDSLGGLLSTIKLRFDKLDWKGHPTENASEITKVNDLIDVACEEVRNISHDLKPGALENLGLVEAIQDLVNRYNRTQGPQIFFQSFGLKPESLPNIDSSTHIYRIIQELIHNAVKHANAKEILVQLQIQDGDLEITVEDDGKGIEPSQSTHGIGLENIKSRVSYLGGNISIDSSPETGTSILILVPLKEKNF